MPIVQPPTASKGRSAGASGGSGMRAAIDSQRPEREILGVQMVLQVEDPREACPVPERVLPRAVVALRPQEIVRHRARRPGRSYGRPRRGPGAPTRSDSESTRPRRRTRSRRSSRRSRPSRRRDSDGARASGPPAGCTRGADPRRWRRARAAPTTCRRCSSRPTGRTTGRRVAERGAGNRSRAGPARSPSGSRGCRASSSPRPVRSSVDGSSRAPWSANGMWFR